MGTNQKLKLERIINIFDAIKSVENNTSLEFVVAYRIGRLGDSCKSALAGYWKTRRKLEKDTNDAINKLQAGWEEKLDEDKLIAEELIEDIKNKFAEEITKIVDLEEEVKIPELNLKDFEGKGVPPKFFMLMGDVIKE